MWCALIISWFWVMFSSFTSRVQTWRLNLLILHPNWVWMGNSWKREIIYLYQIEIPISISCPPTFSNVKNLIISSSHVLTTETFSSYYFWFSASSYIFSIAFTKKKHGNCRAIQRLSPDWPPLRLSFDYTPTLVTAAGKLIDGIDLSCV